MSNQLTYKSFCWSMGTTSFRTENFNKTIEEQLRLLDEFWKKDENKNETWTGNNLLQARYYDFMHDKGFLEGNANKKDKDAREKTSGLVDIGLIDEKRKLSEVGKALLKISLKGDFSSDNQLQISNDSFIYLKQLLKTSYDINNQTVRPFLILINLLNEVDYLTFNEYKNLLPLCIGPNETQQVLLGIKNLREGKTSVNDIIVNHLMSMPNYQKALRFFLENDVSENLICEIGLNRKSRDYDKPYYKLYNELYDLYVCKNANNAINVYLATKKTKIGTLWRNYLFNTVSPTSIKKEPTNTLNKTLFDNTTNEKEFKKAFFKVLHLLKAKASLSDYFDLNRRYFKTSNVLLFEEQTVKFDIIPKYFFKEHKKSLFSEAFLQSKVLFEDCELFKILPNLLVSDNAIINGINAEFGTNIKTLNEAKKILEDNRYQRFNHLVDTKFTDNKLLVILDYLENRNDVEIKKMVTDNADVPTIFEYILGVLWYKVSERKGKILDYMKLSLDSDLFPVTHASGGDSDIVYEYEQNEVYPKHSLLLEATLATKNNQRRIEMEPVSRHLGEHLLATGNLKSYCVFATNDLNINVIADFRGRKSNPYYDINDYSKHVNGMKIIPLEINTLKKIITDKKKYKELYPIFEEAFNSTLPPHEWYKKYIGA